MAGRRGFKPTATQRGQVKLLRADGWTLARIARQLGIDAKTLDKHFPDELEHGADMKQAELLDHANRQAKKGNATLIKWLAERLDAARAEEVRPAASIDEPAPAPKLGKKDAANAAARNADEGTSWAALLKH